MKSGVKTYRLRACGHCGGDAFPEAEDPGSWKCLQRARPVRDDATPLDLEMLHRPAESLFVQVAGG